MKRPEYMCLLINILQQEIINQYKLKELEEGGYVYCDIFKGIYIFPQAGNIDIDLSASRLNQLKYFPFQ